MPRACSVCANPAREAVEKDLLGGRPVLRIAAEYGLAESSLRRHRDRHLAPKLARSLARREEIDGDTLLSWLTGLHDKTLLALAKAEQARDWRAVRGLIREGRENIALLGRIAGIIEPTPATFIDARKQTAVLASLSEGELRALARAASDGSEEAAEHGHPIVTLPAIPRQERDSEVDE